ncbi:MAG: hypothetical protein LBL75_02805 [Rickettsiales bacterium]|jgi:hypothetical protein|nr:hypothetical protein [Rickettsiales bacterium]
MSKESINIGIAGEHLVIAKLSELGFVVSNTEKNTEAIDVLACYPETMKTFAIQVKTTSNQKDWLLGKKNENLIHKNFFYVFVKITKTIPEFYVVPSSIVANNISENHKNWLSAPGKNGQKHNDSGIRTFLPDIEYKDNWGVLK